MNLVETVAIKFSAKACTMTSFLLGRRRLARLFQNWRRHLRIVSTVKHDNFGQTKRFYVSQVNAILFKDGDKKKGSFPKRTKLDGRKPSTESCQSESSRSSDSLPKDCKLLVSSFPPSKPVEKCSLELTSSSYSPPFKEYEKKGRFWKLLTLLGALPVSLIASLIIKSRVEEESKKPRPEYVPMDYMYRRTKRFPWGDGNHTFFHNPERNAVPPDGYEVEDPNEVKTDD